MVLHESLLLWRFFSTKWHCFSVGDPFYCPSLFSPTVSIRQDFTKICLSKNRNIFGALFFAAFLRVFSGQNVIVSVSEILSTVLKKILFYFLRNVLIVQDFMTLLLFLFYWNNLIIRISHGSSRDSFYFPKKKFHFIFANCLNYTKSYNNL